MRNPLMGIGGVDGVQGVARKEPAIKVPGHGSNKALHTLLLEFKIQIRQ